MKYYIFTQGCKINQYESQVLRQAWNSHGWLETDKAEQAEVVLLNGCAVTGRAVSELRRTVTRIAGNQPETRLIVTGCPSKVVEDELSGRYGNVYFVWQEDKDGLRFLAANLESCSEFQKALPGRGQTICNSDLPCSGISSFLRTRAVVKVQDGCSHRCTYCIIPITRGRSRSRMPGMVVSEIRALLHSGVREIVLSGVNLRQYGRDLDQSIDFWDLLLELETELAPDWGDTARFRIGSLEPSDLVVPKALQVLKNSAMVCPHLHISLQSASYSVLKMMGRGHYRPEQLCSFLDDIAHVWEHFALGLDVLVGFPGETEKDFEQTLDFCSRIPLSYAHVFPYSPRPGTAAAGFKGQIANSVKTARAKIIREVAAAKSGQFRKKLLGLPSLKMILEKKGRGMCEYYVECRLDSHRRAYPGDLIDSGNIISVVPQKLSGNVLQVQPADNCFNKED